MIHRHVRSTLLEIGNWIAAGLHHLTHEPIRVYNCPFGIINELLLDGTPGRSKSPQIVRGQGTDVQLFHAVFAFFKLTLSLAPVSALLNDSIVLGTKSVAELLAASLPQIHPARHG
jgi:hypothetical protein